MRETTRRSVLAAAAASLPVLATACKGIAALGPPPRPLPDVAVAREAIAAETLMIARYRAVLAQLPVLAGPLRPVLTQHQDHLARLQARLIDPRAASGDSAAPAAASSRPASPEPAAVPQTVTAALAYLREAEHNAAAALLHRLSVVSPSFAQLLTSIAASEATHVLVLHPNAGTG